MNWTNCNSHQTSKNGRHRGFQRYKCKQCDREFLDGCKPRGYDRTIKEKCLSMYVNGMGFRAIERVMGVHHTTVISWVKKIGNKLDNVPPTQEIPQIFQIDELQSFIGKKKIKFGFGLQLINTFQEL